jgi:hypothetical protein
MLSLPYFLFIEALSPFVELIGYISIITFYILGYLSFEFMIMFFIVAVLWTMWINIGSILLDNLFHRSYKTMRNVLVLCLFGVFEMFGYRQLLVIERVLATFEFKKKGWGHYKRNKINIGSFESLITHQKK